MDDRSFAAIMEHFAVLKDRRIQKKTTHRLVEIIAIPVPAVVCEADGRVVVQTFAETRTDWLKRFLQLWGIVNSLHWSLDVTFRQDDSRMRCGSSVCNFAAIRRLALSLLKQETTAQVGLTNKRL